MLCTPGFGQPGWCRLSPPPESRGDRGVAKMGSTRGPRHDSTTARFCCRADGNLARQGCGQDGTRLRGPRRPRGSRPPAGRGRPSPPRSSPRGRRHFVPVPAPRAAAVSRSLSLSRARSRRRSPLRAPAVPKGGPVDGQLSPEGQREAHR